MSHLLNIANQYDNLCNPQNPGDALTPHEALSRMYSLYRKRFDETALKAFIRCLGVYPPGSVVQLSNEMLGMVLAVNPTNPLRPTVLVHDAEVPRDEAIILELERENDLNISRSLRPSQLPREVYSYLSPRQQVTYYFDATGAG